MQLTNKKINLIILILGLVGILDTIVVLMISSINVGTILPGVIGTLLVSWSIMNLYYPEVIEKYKLPYLKKTLILFFSLWLISFVAIEGLILSSQGSDRDTEVDYLIILGAGLRGEELSRTLHTRMLTGLTFLQDNPQMKVIVSGGQGRGENITEAEAMKRFLVFNGIKESRIIKEESSTSTYENFRHSKEQIIKNGGRRVIIVTNDFHMFRAKMLAERAGLIPYGLPSKTPYVVLINCYLREYFAVIKSYIFDK